MGRAVGRRLVFAMTVRVLVPVIAVATVMMAVVVSVVVAHGFLSAYVWMDAGSGAVGLAHRHPQALEVSEEAV